MFRSGARPPQRKVVRRTLALTAGVLLSAFGGGSPDLVAEIPPSPHADLSVSKTGSPDPVAAGATLTYTIPVHNAGPQLATDATLTDSLPWTPSGYVTFVSASSSQGTCAPSGNTVSCRLGDLSGDATVTIVVRIPRLAASTTITNTASVRSSVDDPYTANNTFSVHTTANPSPDLSITKTDSPDPIWLDEGNLTYTVTVINDGPGTATGVTLTDTLPSGVEFGSASSSRGSCTQSGGAVTCPIGTLGNGARATATIVVKPTSAGTIANTARVTAAEPDPGPANNEAVQGTTVNAAAADLSLTKTDSPDPVPARFNLTYTVTVTNRGHSRATGVTLTDALPSGVEFGSASSSQGSCPRPGGTPVTLRCDIGTLARGASATVTIVVRPRAEGTITNTASVTGTVPDPDPANNRATETTAVGPSADLVLEKTGSVATALLASTVTYRVTVTNNGPLTATNVTMTDALPVPAGPSVSSTPPTVTFASASSSQGSCTTSVVRSSLTLTCPIGTLARGASATVTIVLRVTADATLRNSAGVTANEPDPIPANNTAAVTTTITRPPLPGARPVPTPTPPRLPPAPPFPPRSYPSPK